MSNWLLKASNNWLVLLYEKMKTKLLEHNVLYIDETTVQLLKEPGKAVLSKSYMWVYRISGEAETISYFMTISLTENISVPENY